MTPFNGRFFAGLLACIALCVCSCAPQRSGAGAVDADAPTEFTSTDSGLKYRILRRSDGRKPTQNNRVTVDYSGWLDNNTIFDSSYEHPEPTSFLLTDGVPGWTEGVQLIGVGGMIELEIPPDLGYGAAGQPGKIPPNATLHFKVELHEIK